LGLNINNTKGGFEPAFGVIDNKVNYSASAVDCCASLVIGISVSVAQQSTAEAE